MGRSIYEPPDIPTEMALRQTGATQETFIQFESIRSLPGSADATFSFGPRASRPTSGALGDRYFANNIGSRGGWLYYWNGTTWAIVVGWASGADAARAALTVSSVDNGAWFYATDTQKFWEVSAGSWADRTPAGGVSGLTTGTLPKAASATSLTNSILSESGNDLILNNASYRLRIGTSGTVSPTFSQTGTTDIAVSQASGTLSGVMAANFYSFNGGLVFDLNRAGSHPGLALSNGFGVAFSSSSTNVSSIDVKLIRSAAGVLDLINGTAGTFRDLSLRKLGWSGQTVYDSSGTGSPEGVVTAGIGSTYRRTDGGAGTSFYVKESGTGNTGWVAK